MFYIGFKWGGKIWSLQFVYIAYMERLQRATTMVWIMPIKYLGNSRISDDNNISLINFDQVIWFQGV